jgi:hypothetical protein
MQLIALAADPALRSRLSDGALRRGKEFRWSDKIQSIYGEEQEIRSTGNIL